MTSKLPYDIIQVANNTVMQTVLRKSHKGVSMKKIFCSLICLLLCFSFFSCGDSRYRELGIPSLANYEKGAAATYIPDMIIHSGKLYVGGGDYDKNAGPVTVWAYDLAQSQWQSTGVLTDEEIARFLLLDGKLTVPGTDPMGDWSSGNFYFLRDGAWESAVIPAAVHNFDLIKYDGWLFAGLGVVPGGTPIVRSSDGGESFFPVSLYKEGALLDTSLYETVRVYDFLLCQGKLYALLVYGNDALSFDLYRYDEGVFAYHCDFGKKTERLKISRKALLSKVSFGGKLFFTTGRLYATEDMQGFIPSSLNEEYTVHDLLVSDKKLYALCSKKEKEGYRISVFRNKNGETDKFKEVLSFSYPAPPMSFAKSEDAFYIGIGTLIEETELNGMVLEVPYR